MKNSKGKGGTVLFFVVVVVSIFFSKKYKFQQIPTGKTKKLLKLAAHIWYNKEGNTKVLDVTKVFITF